MAERYRLYAMGTRRPVYEPDNPRVIMTLAQVYDMGGAARDESSYLTLVLVPMSVPVLDTDAYLSASYYDKYGYFSHQQVGFMDWE